MKMYTPGPWRVLKPKTMPPDNNWHVTDEADTFVAHVFGFSHSVNEQSRINALLIAAAPDLLEACEAALYVITNAPRTRDKLRSAIDKAMGGAA